MPDAVVLAAALVVCALPGAAVLTALGVRHAMMLAVLAVPGSIAVAGLTATATGATGLPYGAAALAAVTAAAAAVAVVRHRRSRRTRPRRVPVWRRVPAPALAAGAGLGLVGTALAVATWWRALGGQLGTYPQEHDTIVHTLLTAWIARSGRAAPWQLLPLDVTTGEPVSFYPAGLHLLAGTVADLGADAVPALNAVTLVLLAVAAPLAAGALTVVAARGLGLGRGPATVSGGVAAIVAAGLYRPVVQLAHDGGALPNAAALALTPAVVAGLLMLPRARPGPAVGAGLASVGIVWLHPSAAVSVGLTVLAWWAGEAVTRRGRHRLRGLPAPLLVAGATAAVLLAPVLLAASAAAARTSDFPADTAPTGYSEALGATLGLAYGGYVDPGRTTGQLWAAVLVAVGLAAVLVRRRGLGPVAAWAWWSAVTLGYFLSPSSGWETAVTAFLYKAMVRVWSHVSLTAPVLAGLGVVLLAARAAVQLRRVGPLRARALATVLAVLAAAGYAAGPGAGYAQFTGAALATRYAEPAFVRVGADDRRAAAWLAARARPGERILNSPNDGSTFLYVEYGLPIVNVYPLGLAAAPYSYRLLESFDRYPADPGVRRMLRELNVRWVYVDEQAPTIGAAGSPEDWAGDRTFRLAPGLRDLDGLPGLRRVYGTGSVSVYRLDLDAATALP